MTHQFYRVLCSFEPDHINPLTGRHGQWRVKKCIPCSEYKILLYRLLYIHVDDTEDGEKWSLALVTQKPYSHGSIIRPHKELNRVLTLRRKPKCQKHDTGGGPCYCEGSIHAEAA